jgi:hypothetical protein
MLVDQRLAHKLNGHRLVTTLEVPIEFDHPRLYDSELAAALSTATSRDLARRLRIGEFEDDSCAAVRGDEANGMRRPV